MVQNTVRARSAGGDATAAAGATVARDQLTDSAAIGNTVRASSPEGTALAAGGAVVVDRELTLRDTTIRGNTASAQGAGGFSRGGGIFDAPLFTNGGALTLVDSMVTQNVAGGSPRITPQGGGIYISQRRLTLLRSTVGDNLPDQVCGC
jgi:hypothetical protein